MLEARRPQIPTRYPDLLVELVVAPVIVVELPLEGNSGEHAHDTTDDRPCDSSRRSRQRASRRASKGPGEAHFRFVLDSLLSS